MMCKQIIQWYISSEVWNKKLDFLTEATLNESQTNCEQGIQEYYTKYESDPGNHNISVNLCELKPKLKEYLREKIYQFFHQTFSQKIFPKLSDRQLSVITTLSPDTPPDSSVFSNAHQQLHCLIDENIRQKDLETIFYKDNKDKYRWAQLGTMLHNDAIEYIAVETFRNIAGELKQLLYDPEKKISKTSF